MTLSKYTNRLLGVLAAFAWLLISNIAVTEAAFAMIHSSTDSQHHSHSAEVLEGHEHHSQYHPGHNREHTHGEEGEPHSHGKDILTSFTSPRQVLSASLIEVTFIQTVSIVTLFYTDLLSVWVPLGSKAILESPLDNVASRLLSSLTISSNAPPANL